MDKKEEAARTVRLSDIGTQLAENITGGSLASAVRPGGQFDQAVNLPYIAADQRVEIGQAAQMYPAMKRKWARENMGSELATDQEIRVFIASRVREDDARKAKIAKAEARAYRLFDAGKGRGPFDVSPAGDLYRKETKVGEREEDGSFTVRDPGDLRQMVKQTGGAPIFFENERVKQARANDSNYENLGQFMGNLGQVAGRGALIPKISYTYQLPTAKSEMLRERAAAALRHEERKATLLNGNAELGGQLELKRQQIETTGLTGEQKEAALRDLEAEAAKQVVHKQGTRNELIQGAFEDLNAGYLSVQQFAELLEAGGQDNALETIISAKEDEAIQESAETKLAALKIGSTEFWSRGEGSDPRATKRYRELSRMIATPGLMVTNLRTRSSELKPDSRLTDESYREQSIRDWQDDGTYVARLATPEERFSYVEGLPEMQAMQQGITAFKVKEDALLKPYGFDPATEERIKHRALMAAARELPRDTAEWAGNADNWLSRMPVGGGFYAGAIMLPVAMLVHRLDKGEQLSQEELAMLDDTLIELERPNTWWANTLSMTVDSASIATEMYLTAGIGTAVRKGATKVTEEVFAHALRRFATEKGRKLIRKQMGTRALAGAAGVAAQTVTGTGSRVLHRAIEDLATSGVQVTQNEVGQYVAVLDATQRPGSVWEAFGKAARYQFMENTSEKLGSILTAMGGDKVVKRAMDGLTGPMRERLSKHAWLMAFKQANPGKSLEVVQRALARANVDSFPVELMEEGGAAALHWAFDGEEFTLPTMKDAASLYVSMLLTGTAMKIASLRDGRHGKGATDEQSSVLERALGEQPGTAERVGAGQVVEQAGTGGNGMSPSPSAEQVRGNNGEDLSGDAGEIASALAGAAMSNGVQLQAAGATAVAVAPGVDAIGKQAESGEAQMEPVMAGQAAEVNASGAGANGKDLQSSLLGEATSQQAPMDSPSLSDGGMDSSTLTSPLPQMSGGSGPVEGHLESGTAREVLGGDGTSTTDQLHETNGKVEGKKQQAAPLSNRLSGTNWSHTRVTANNPGNGKRMADHVDHASAMAGDVQAAERLVQEVVPEAELKDAAVRHPKARIVALPSSRASGKADALSTAYARRMAAATGLSVSEEITVHQTALSPGSSLMRRMAFRPRFKGRVEPGAEYVVVAGQMDPVELATFRHFIERKHGRVVEVRGLGDVDATNVPITQETADAVKAKFRVKDGINPTLRANGLYGGVVDAMTEAEGLELLKTGAEKDLSTKLMNEARAELLAGYKPEKGKKQWVPTKHEIRAARGMTSWEKVGKEEKAMLKDWRGKMLAELYPKLDAKALESKNVAFVRGRLFDEVLPVRFESSGYRPDSFGGRKIRYFEAVTIGHGRGNDTEVFLLEGLAHEIMERTHGRPEMATGEVELNSQNDFCESCQGVIELFREMFPNVKLTLKAG